MNVSNARRIAARLTYTIALLLPAHSLYSQPAGLANNDITVRFTVEGGQVGQVGQVGSNPPPKVITDILAREGEVLSAAEVLAFLRDETGTGGTRSLFQNADLWFYVENAKGEVLARELLARCSRLNLFAEPSSPDVMKAKCDDVVFEYAATSGGISLMRNGDEWRAFEMPDGVYLVDGRLHRVLSDHASPTR